MSIVRCFGSTPKISPQILCETSGDPDGRVSPELSEILPDSSEPFGQMRVDDEGVAVMSALLRQQHDSLMSRLDGWMARQESWLEQQAPRLGPADNDHHSDPHHIQLNPPAPASYQLEVAVSSNSTAVLESHDLAASSSVESPFSPRVLSSAKKKASEWNTDNLNATAASKYSRTPTFMMPTDESDANTLSGSMASIQTGMHEDAQWGTSEAPTNPLRLKLKHLVESDRFGFLLGVLITLNCVFIGIEVENEAQGLNLVADSGMVVFGVFQQVFNACFVAELVLRLGAYGRGFFCTRNLLWNYLDLVLVLNSMFTVVIKLASLDGSSPGSLNHVRVVRIVRVTRLVKIFRIARIARFVRALRVLLQSMVFSLKSLIGAALLVWLTIYFFAILFTQAVGQYLLDCDKDEADGCGAEDNIVLRRYWGTLPRSMFTLFKTMTGGVDWDYVAHPLSVVHSVWVAAFVIFVSFVFFALTNLVTGVFCQSAMESVQYDRELLTHEVLANKEMYVECTQALFKSMFSKLDSKRTGTINMNEFESHLADREVKAFFALLDLDTSDAWTLFKLLDLDGTNIVDAEEFVDGCLKLKGAARSIDLTKLTFEMRWLMKVLYEHIDHAEGELEELRRALLPATLQPPAGTRAASLQPRADRALPFGDFIRSIRPADAAR